MGALRIGPGLLAISIAVFAPSLAAAEEPAEPLIPPGNSAVNQYTESFPTAGGNRETGKRGGGKSDRSPADVLGARNARRLAVQGPGGRAAAEVAAATAPGAVSATLPGADQGTGTAGGGDADRSGESASRAGGGSAGGPRSGVDGPSGSSGLGEVIAEATGSSSSGEMGLLLPLAIAAAAAWSVAFLVRRTRRAAR